MNIGAVWGHMATGGGGGGTLGLCGAKWALEHIRAVSGQMATGRVHSSENAAALELPAMSKRTFITIS